MVVTVNNEPRNRSQKRSASCTYNFTLSDEGVLAPKGCGELKEDREVLI